MAVAEGAAVVDDGQAAIKVEDEEHVGQVPARGDAQKSSGVNKD